MNATNNGHVSAEAVKAAARGRWRDVLTANGFSGDDLDGRHHPCPKCHGTDRFSLVDEDAGAVLCRHCFTEKNGDGLAAIQWLNGWTFPETLKAVAGYLNIANSHTNGKPADIIADVARAKRMPAESFRAFGARAAHRDGVPVARVPMFGPDRKDCSYFDLALVSAKHLKGMSAEGKPVGLFVPTRDDEQNGTKRRVSTWPAAGETVFVTEGVKDAAALHGRGFFAVGLPGSKMAAKFARVFADCHVVIVPDRDKTGEDAAQVTAARLAGVAASVRIATLPGEMKAKDGDGVREVLTMRDGEALLRQAIEDAKPWQPATKEEAVPSNVIEEDDDPHRLGRNYLDQFGRTDEGEQMIAFYRGEFWRWNSVVNSYELFPDSELRGELTKAVKIQLDEIATLRLAGHLESEKDGPPPKAKRVTRSLVGNVLNVVESMTGLPSKKNQPFWLTDDVPPFDASEMLVAQNGLVHLPSLGTDRPALLPPTPLFFTTSALGCPFDPQATCPVWMNFLDTVWGDDQQSIETLAEWFGYLLLLDVSHHKMLLLVGPPRSGKGTIGRALKLLLGSDSVANPTLGSLAGSFGLWLLLNKSAAVISDARLSGQVDGVAILERLLSISGGDPQNVDRKCLPTVTAVSLPVRFTILTNELPRLTDAGGAIASRFVVLKMTRNFWGREDKELDRKLTREIRLSAIHVDCCGCGRLKRSRIRRRKFRKLAMPKARQRMERKPRLKPSVGPLDERFVK